MDSFLVNAQRIFDVASSASGNEDFALLIRPDGGLHFVMESPFSLRGRGHSRRRGGGLPDYTFTGWSTRGGPQRSQRLRPAAAGCAEIAVSRRSALPGDFAASDFFHFTVVMRCRAGSFGDTPRISRRARQNHPPQNVTQLQLPVRRI